MLQLVVSRIVPPVGIVVVFLVLQDVFEVLLRPRRVSRSRRIASTIMRPVDGFGGG